ncbi:MAG: hypothetical protein E7167_02210 [Firmicutes bacterium]|nr:hypothetical protein [Bacillota bacterium]
MKKFLTFVLCFCIMFTFSVGASFAAVVSTTYKSEVVKNAVESVCTVDLTKYSKSMEEVIANEIAELRTFAAGKESLDAEVLKAIDELKDFLADNTLAAQEAELKEIKTDAIIKFENKVDAYVASKEWTEDQIKLGEKTEFEADVKAFTDWFIGKRFYHPGKNVINSGHETGSTELTFASAKADIEYLNGKVIDDAWFAQIVGMLDEVKNVKYEADKYYADLAHYSSDTYSAGAIAAAKAETYAGIELLDITDVTKFVEPKTIEQEKADKTEADAKALVDAKKAAIFAITAGDYYVGNWSGEAKAYVADIQSKYTVYINAATTIAKVDAYKYEAMRLMGGYQSDVQIKDENDKLIGDLNDTKEELDKTKEELEAIKKEMAFDKAMDNLSVKARSAKTSKGYIKITAVADTEELEELGYTVKYKFYRATSKNGEYVAKFTSKGTYTNTGGTKGKMYYYRVKALVYDADGQLVAETKIKDCKYACRKFGK